MLIYTLYKAFTASADGAVSVTMVKGGRITSIEWALQPDLDADGEIFLVELALVPILQSRTHDSQGAISCVCGCVAQLTSGQANADYNKQILKSIPISAGQKLYLNGALTGTTSVPATCLVTVS